MDLAMTIIHNQACIQKLTWARGEKTTWRTIAVFNTKEAAINSLLNYPLSQNHRVLYDNLEAVSIGHLTRDRLSQPQTEERLFK